MTSESLKFIGNPVRVHIVQCTHYGIRIHVKCIIYINNIIQLHTGGYSGGGGWEARTPPWAWPLDLLTYRLY